MWRTHSILLGIPWDSLVLSLFLSLSHTSASHECARYIRTYHTGKAKQSNQPTNQASQPASQLAKSIYDSTLHNRIGLRSSHSRHCTLSLSHSHREIEQKRIHITTSQTVCAKIPESYTLLDTLLVVCALCYWLDFSFLFFCTGAHWNTFSFYHFFLGENRISLPILLYCNSEHISKHRVVNKTIVNNVMLYVINSQTFFLFSLNCKWFSITFQTDKN